MRKSLFALLAGLAVGAAALPAFAEAPFNFDTAPGRLSKWVVPLDYRIAIVPNVQAKTFTGQESITLEVRRPSATIAFNTLDLQVTSARVDGARVVTIDTQNAKQLTTLRLHAPLAPGRHTLMLAYAGKLQGAPAGLFAQPYRSAGAMKTMLSTQFEATDARRMFPSWDEPAFRSTYQLTATVPAHWAVVSNTPVESRVAHGALATTTFRRTPKMPSYLVEFSAGELSRISANAGGVEHGVWTVTGQQGYAAYALAQSQQILADYNEYFGQKYPLPKLDHIAVPGGFQGAMENWGAITYNDQALLTPPEAEATRKQEVFSIEAHEMAHQWNGDLVTMGWWDDIWLNESFASWMAAKETDLRNPGWHWLERQDGAKETAMHADARANSHAIQQHVTDELQAEASFDSAITYNKGEAFLRMLEAYLGPDTFRAGIRRYMAAHAFSNATSADLWNALSAASHLDVAAVAAKWTEQPGFPLVSVSAACDAAGNRTVTLAQQRFLSSGSDPAHLRWTVPMRIRSGAAAPQTVMFVNDGQTVSAGRCTEPLSANADALGYYRVKYDDATFAQNRSAFASLSNPDRIALLDDQWALARTGRSPLSSYLALASAMGNSLDLRAWQQIVGGGGRNRDGGALGELAGAERGKPGEPAYLAFARSVLRPVAATLGWDPKPGEDVTAGELRGRVLDALGRWGEPAVITEARARFARMLADPSAVPVEQQDIVLPIVAANADQATFDRLHALLKSAKSESQMRRYVAALLGVRDPKLAAQVLDIAISSDLPPQAASLRGRMVFALAAEHPQLAWAFYRKHVDQLSATQSEFQLALAQAQAVPVVFRRAAPLSEIEAWLAPRVPRSLATFEARGLETARQSAAEEQRLVSETDSYLAAAR